MAKMTENESSQPQNRDTKSPGKGSEGPKNIGVGSGAGDGKVAKKGPNKKLYLLFLLLFLLGAGLFIFDRWGNSIYDRWGNLTFKDSNDATTNNQTETKTCVDKENAKEGYELYRNDTYKYCILYPTDWPVESNDPRQITFGTVNPEPTPGWFKVSYFSGQTQAGRATEIKANYIHPAGPCTESSAMVSGQTALKLNCIGAFDGESHMFYLVSEGGNLFELSYIMGTDTTKTLYEAEYRVMVESFLTDTFANQ